MPVNKSALIRYQLIEKLLSKMKYSRKELLDRINQELDNKISIHQLTLDIGFMRNHFKAPIKTSKAGYNYSDPSFSIFSIRLSKSEELALAFALNVLETSSNLILVQEAQTVLKKLYRKSDSKSNNSGIISSDLNLSVVGINWLTELYTSILDKESLLIDYFSQRLGERVKHNFSPYLLKEYQGMWYVIGYSAKKELTIVLALDRIKDIRTSNTSYYEDTSFNPEKYFKYSFGITHRQFHQPEKVKFWVDKKAFYYMKVRQLHISQKVLEETDDGFIVQLEVYLSEELLITLMGLGGRVKVLEPVELVNDIKQHLEKMKTYYK
jgi:predicted DNA-binding transcriptional regulator YafY